MFVCVPFHGVFYPTPLCLIDTGFSGAIVVPATEELKQYPTDALPHRTMADDQRSGTDLFGTIRFQNLQILLLSWLAYRDSSG